MNISYSNLWKTLIDKKMKKKDLMALTGLSKSTISKLSKNENVNTSVLVRICDALNCELKDVATVQYDEGDING